MFSHKLFLERSLRISMGMRTIPVQSAMVYESKKLTLFFDAQKTLKDDLIMKFRSLGD